MPLLTRESLALLSPTPPTPPASLQHTGGGELISHCASLTFPSTHQAGFIMVALRRGFRLHHRLREEMEPLDITCNKSNCEPVSPSGLRMWKLNGAFQFCCSSPWGAEPAMEERLNVMCCCFSSGCELWQMPCTFAHSPPTLEQQYTQGRFHAQAAH
ncbi:uncharacterized [Tachysurus ichikawai]